MNWTLFPIDEVWAAEAPAELVGEIAPIDLYASDHMDARITIEAPDNTRGQAQISADRRALMKIAQAPFFRRTMADEIPWVGCQFPTNAYAQEAGMPLSAFEDWFYGACLRDWDAEGERMRRYCERFDAADEIRIVGAETDLRLSLKGRKGEVDDGHVNMPGGEFFFSPNEDSAEGTILFDVPTELGTAPVSAIRLTFRKGRVEEASAEEGEAELLAALDMDEGARFIGELGIGCNTGITQADAEHPLRREDGRDDPHRGRRELPEGRRHERLVAPLGPDQGPPRGRPDRARRRSRPGERQLADLDAPRDSPLGAVPGTRPNVALATSAEIPEGDEDFEPLIAALAAEGVVAEAAVWDDPAVDWPRFDLVLPRATWDYAERRDEFLAWAAAMRWVLNPLEVLEWNTDKERYLTDLAARGVPVVPTEFVAPGAQLEQPDGPFVVKPAISAGGRNSARFDPADAEAARELVARIHAAGRTAMVQPFLGEDEETALVYIDGAYSHAVRRRVPLPAAGARDVFFLDEELAQAEATPKSAPSPRLPFPKDSSTAAST